MDSKVRGKAAHYARLLPLDVDVSGSSDGSRTSDCTCEGYPSDYADDEACSPYDLSSFEEEMLLAGDNEAVAADSEAEDEVEKGTACRNLASRANDRSGYSDNEISATGNESVYEDAASKVNSQLGVSDYELAATENVTATDVGEKSLPCPPCPEEADPDENDLHGKLRPDSRHSSCSDRVEPTLTNHLVDRGESRLRHGPPHFSCYSGDGDWASVAQEDFDTTLDNLSIFIDNFNCEEDTLLAEESIIDPSLDDNDKSQAAGSNINPSLDDNDNSLVEGSNIHPSLDDNDKSQTEGSNIDPSLNNNDFLLAGGSFIYPTLGDNDNSLGERSSIDPSLCDTDMSHIEGSNIDPSLNNNNLLLAEGSNIYPALGDNDNSLTEGSNIALSLADTDKSHTEGSNIDPFLDNNANSLAEGSNVGTFLDEDEKLLAEGSNVGSSLEEDEKLLAEGSNTITSLDEDEKLLAEESNMVTSLDEDEKLLAEGSNMITSLDKDEKLLADGYNMVTSLDEDEKLLAEGSNRVTSLDEDEKLLAEGSNMVTSLDEDEKLLAERLNVGISLDDSLLERSRVGTFLDGFDTTLPEGCIDDDNNSMADSVYTISSTEEDLLLADDDDIEVMIVDGRNATSVSGATRDATGNPACVITLDSSYEDLSALEPACKTVVVDLDDSDVQFIAMVPETGAVPASPRDAGQCPEPRKPYTPKTPARSWPAFPGTVASRPPPPEPPRPPPSEPPRPPPPEPPRPPALEVPVATPPGPAGRAWQEVFISSDPAENRDNFDPRWEELRSLKTDEERYHVLTKGWRNLHPPNPNRNLTSRLVGDPGCLGAHYPMAVSQHGIERDPDQREAEGKWGHILQGADADVDRSPQRRPESSRRPSRRSRSADSRRKPRRGDRSPRPRRRGRSVGSHRGEGTRLRRHLRGGEEEGCLSGIRLEYEGVLSLGGSDRNNNSDDKWAGQDSGRAEGGGGGGRKRPREEDGGQLPPAKRPRSVACKKLYEDMLREVVWKREERLATLDNVQRAELANLQHQQILQLTHMSNSIMQHQVPGLVMQQTQILHDVCERHESARQQLMQEYESRIAVLEAALAELTIFYDFYKGVTTEDSSLLTDVEVQELIEVEETINNYSSVYGN